MAEDGSYWYTWKCPALLRLNKQIHLEALPFYCGGDRVFTITRPGHPIKWLQTIGPVVRGYITSLRLVLEHDEDLSTLLCLLASCQSLKDLWIKLRSERPLIGSELARRRAFAGIMRLTSARELFLLPNLKWLAFMDGQDDKTTSFNESKLALMRTLF